MWFMLMGLLSKAQKGAGGDSMKANRSIDGFLYFDEVRGGLCMDEGRLCKALLTPVDKIVDENKELFLGL